jgi:hypothetical protein
LRAVLTQLIIIYCDSILVQNPVAFYLNMKIIILTPMEIEQEKVQDALSRIPDLKHNYEVVVSGIGRESSAKALMQLPLHDVCILMGFAAIIGNQNDLPAYLGFGKPIEITNSSLYGYEGGLFENGAPIFSEPKTKLPSLASLTSDKFVRTTDLAAQTIINMEDYTFMFLKKPQDFIIRIISDFLPHESEIDFFEEVKAIDFFEAMQLVDFTL